MKAKKKFIMPAVAALTVILIIVNLFFPVNDVNVIFDRCMNSDELATVFRNTSFESSQYCFVDIDRAGLSMTSNNQLFGTPLEGTAIDAAITAERRNRGIIVLDGSVSLIDMVKIEKSPFVDNIIIYFPILDMGDRDILPESSMQFFAKHPEARYWE